MKKSLLLEKNEERAISALKEALSNRFHLLDFRLFGSKARGEGRAGSDIDIMIVLDKCDPVMRSEVYDIVFETNLKYDTFISTTIFTREELEEGPMSESPIYKIIRKEGIAI
ncbi:MAG: nucleotidyltransferase domain-containing protein [Desulfobacterales bacterium]|nr:nucleotidyltransferase domain-containing protein [Desulfobacterales bacterium]